MKDYTARCMGSEVMKSEYPDVKQRYAVCMSEAERAGRKTPPKLLAKQDRGTPKEKK